MTQKILVPLDGSDVGEAVLPKLQELVLRDIPGKEVEITLLKVISKMNFNALHEDEAAQLPYSEAEVKQLTDEANSYLNSVADNLKAKGFKVKVIVTFGSAAPEIVKAANGTDANLIAMATHGRSGFVRWAIGSVSDKVIRLEGKIPVLALRSSGEKESNPVIATDSLQSLMRHI
ncbi:universal stress protein [Chloroflexota bacterium]